MALKIRCPSCGASLSAPDSYHGKSITCPKCNSRFTALTEEEMARLEEQRKKAQEEMAKLQEEKRKEKAERVKAQEEMGRQRRRGATAEPQQEAAERAEAASGIIQSKRQGGGIDELYEFSKTIGNIDWGTGIRKSYIVKLHDRMGKLVSVYYVYYEVGRVWFPFERFRSKTNPAYETFMEDLSSLLGISSLSGNPTCSVHTVMNNLQKFKEAIVRLKAAIAP